MTITEVIELIATICSLVGVVCGLIPTVIALVKKVKEVVKNKDWTTICECAKTAMTEVEKCAKEDSTMTSEDKLNKAVDIVKETLKPLGITIDDALLTQLTAYINELCSWSKTVNSDN